MVAARTAVTAMLRQVLACCIHREMARVEMGFTNAGKELFGRGGVIVTCCRILFLFNTSSYYMFRPVVSILRFALEQMEPVQQLRESVCNPSMGKLGRNM